MSASGDADTNSWSLERVISAAISRDCVSAVAQRNEAGAHSDGELEHADAGRVAKGAIRNEKLRSSSRPVCAAVTPRAEERHHFPLLDRSLDAYNPVAPAPPLWFSPYLRANR
jgi:hypothetical protein